MGIQTFHMTEHFIQVDQHFFQGLSIEESGGIVKELNLEEVHWVYNTSYFVLLLILWKKISLIRKLDKSNLERLIVILFTLTVIFQGYHVLEHTVRVAQYLVTGCTPCIGWLGNFINPIMLHFIINFMVFIYPIPLFYKVLVNRR